MLKIKVFMVTSLCFFSFLNAVAMKNFNKNSFQETDYYNIDSDYFINKKNPANNTYYNEENFFQQEEYTKLPKLYKRIVDEYYIDNFIFRIDKKTGKGQVYDKNTGDVRVAEKIEGKEDFNEFIKDKKVKHLRALGTSGILENGYFKETKFLKLPKIYNTITANFSIDSVNVTIDCETGNGFAYDTEQNILFRLDNWDNESIDESSIKYKIIVKQNNSTKKETIINLHKVDTKYNLNYDKILEHNKKNLNIFNIRNTKFTIDEEEKGYAYNIKTKDIFEIKKGDINLDDLGRENLKYTIPKDKKNYQKFEKNIKNKESEKDMMFFDDKISPSKKSSNNINCNTSTINNSESKKMENFINNPKQIYLEDENYDIISDYNIKNQKDTADKKIKTFNFKKKFFEREEYKKLPSINKKNTSNFNIENLHFTIDDVTGKGKACYINPKNKEKTFFKVNKLNKDVFKNVSLEYPVKHKMTLNFKPQEKATLQKNEFSKLPTIYNVITANFSIDDVDITIDCETGNGFAYDNKNKILFKIDEWTDYDLHENKIIYKMVVKPNDPTKKETVIYMQKSKTTKKGNSISTPHDLKIDEKSPTFFNIRNIEFIIDEEEKGYAYNIKTKDMFEIKKGDISLDDILTKNPADSLLKDVLKNIKNLNNINFDTATNENLNSHNSTQKSLQEKNDGDYYTVNADYVLNQKNTTGKTIKISNSEKKFYEDEKYKKLPLLYNEIVVLFNIENLHFTINDITGEGAACYIDPENGKKTFFKVNKWDENILKNVNIKDELSRKMLINYKCPKGTTLEENEGIYNKLPTIYNTITANFSINHYDFTIEYKTGKGFAYDNENNILFKVDKWIDYGTDKDALKFKFIVKPNDPTKKETVINLHEYTPHKEGNIISAIDNDHCLEFDKKGIAIFNINNIKFIIDEEGKGYAFNLENGDVFKIKKEDINLDEIGKENIEHIKPKNKKIDFKLKKDIMNEINNNIKK